MDYQNWVTKQQAAELLKVSEKTIERMACRGELQKATRRLRGQVPKVVFHPDDLNRILGEQEEAQAFVLKKEPETNSGQALVKKPPIKGPESLLCDLLAATGVKPSEKLFLTLEEAAVYSGLSKTYLKRAIRAGELTAIRDGSYKIRRWTLEELVGQL